jgi:hypothetical protein
MILAHAAAGSSSRQVGERVVRGPDWKWSDQDGGKGTVGVVMKTERSHPGSQVCSQHQSNPLLFLHYIFWRFCFCFGSNRSSL